MPLFRNKLKFVFLFLCGLIISYIVLYQLGKAPFENWDEAWYADVTRHMLRSKEFFVLYWNKALFLDKPPMFMWFGALSTTLFGFSEFAMRLPSALSAIAVVMLVVAYTYRRFGFVPSLLAFMSLALNNVFIWRARSANIDLLVTLFIVLTYFVVLSTYKYKYYVLGVLFGSIYLTKASLVLLPISIFVIHELLFERKKLVSHLKSYVGLVAIVVTMIGLWLLAGFLKVGEQFAQYYLFAADQGVGSLQLAHANIDYVKHMYYALQRRFFFVFIIGTAFLLRFIREKEHILLLLYATLLVVQLSFTERNNNWYLIPAMPFWSIVIAYGTYQVMRLCRNHFVVTAGILLLSSYVSYKTFTGNILPIIHSSGPIAQAESTKRLATLTKEKDIVVRLDHLYPTTVYYTDRKVLASPVESSTRSYFISRVDLVTAVQKKKIKWLVGANQDIDAFLLQIPNVSIKKTAVNSEESIIEIR